jgi:oxamate amidohydrolase
VTKALEAKGHKVKVLPAFTQVMGSIQVIMLDTKSGVMRGAADPRADGVALGY